MLPLAERLRGTEEYYFSMKLQEIERLRKDGYDIINLGIGNPDLPPHPDVIKVLQDESLNPKQHGYQSYNGHPILRKAFADWYSREYSVNVNPDDEVLPLIGSKEGIMIIAMTYINPGDKVLIPDPGYPSYRAAVEIAGGICVPYQLTEENNWLPDFDQIEKMDLRGVKMMWLNYPHMPTGKSASKKLFADFVSFGKRHNILMCHDNPYSMVDNDEPLSILSVDGAMDNCIELNSMSKTFNMAGWRIGAAFGNAEHLKNMLRFKSNMANGMYLPMQFAAAKALALDAQWYEMIRATYRKRRAIVNTIAEKLNCSVGAGQQGIFVWAKIPDNAKDAFTFSDNILKEKNIFITPGGIFGDEGKRFVRLTLCANENVLTKVLERLDKKWK